MKLKKTLSGVLAVTTLLLSSMSTFGSASAYSVETKDTPQSSAANAPNTSGTIEDASTSQLYNYGLNSTIEGGTILHAWEWSFDTIRENMPLIAQSGYTAVQTSPASLCYEYSNNPEMNIMGKLDDNGDSSYKGGKDAWWWTYQPTALVIGNYQLGYRDAYVTMCKEAKKYGVKVITDVVLKHTTSSDKKAGNTVNGKFDLLAGNQGYLGNNGAQSFDTLYHSMSNLAYSSGLVCPDETADCSRFQIINYDRGGLPDLNTENPYVQRYILNYLNDLISAGCDGFRFDTAQNIGIPGDPTKDSNNNNTESNLNYNFWPLVTGHDEISVSNTTYKLSTERSSDFFFYGEIMGNIIHRSDVSGMNNDQMFAKYAEYIAVTDSEYGSILRDNVGNKNKKDQYFDASIIAGNNDGTYWGAHPLQSTSDKLVTWVESHDNYCNDHASKHLSNRQIRACWAVIAARSGGTPLFFNRPDGSSGTDQQYWGKNVIGERGNDEFFHPEVVAVNKFRNAMSNNNATEENVVNVNSNNQVLQIDRFPVSNKSEFNCGTCIINLSDSEVSVNGQSTSIADGTYYDTITGKKFVVDGGAFTSQSDKISARSIATIYNTANIFAAPDTKSFTTNTLDVIANISGCAVTTGTYRVKCDGEEDTTGTFTSGTPFSIGGNINAESSPKKLTLILEANVGGKIITRQYIYTKRDSSDVTYAYFDKSRGYGDTVYAYIYNTVTDTNNEMSKCTYKNSEWPGVQMTADPSSDYLRVEIPPELKDGNIIFNNGSGTQYPENGSSIVLNLNNKSMLLSGNATALTEYQGLNISDENIVPEEDTDFSTYRYTYFFNSLAWSGIHSAVLSNGSRNDEFLLEYSDDLHCYYCKYPVEREYTTIQFKFGSNSITASQIKPGMVFVPTTASTGTWILPSSIAERTIYFTHFSGWTDGVYAYLYNGDKKNATEPGVLMTKTIKTDGTSDDYDLSYTYYYPVLSVSDTDYTTVRFTKSENTDNKPRSVDYTIPTDKTKIYKYNRENNKTNGNYNLTCNVISNTTNKPVIITYTGNKVADSKGSASYSLDTQQTINTNVDVTNGNLPKALADASTSLSMTSVFDDFTFYGSQFQYVSKIASLTDDRIGDGTLPYCAYVNPETLSKQSDAFSAVYQNSDNYISTLNSAQNSWVKYVDNNENEISLNQIQSDFANLKRIEVYAFSKPKTYTVKFHYPTSDNSSLTAFANNTLFTHTANAKLYECRYNELLEDATAAIESDMITNPDGKTFDGWYMLDNANNITSYLKVSSEKDYKYRITDQNINLYAVFRNSSTAPAKTATALASSVDKFQVNVPKESQSTDNGVRYRYNTILNINDYKTTDGTVTDVAVVYAYSSSSVNSSTAKNQVKNTFINNNTNTTFRSLWWVDDFSVL